MDTRHIQFVIAFFGNEQGTEQAISHIEAFQDKIKKELPYLTKAEEVLKGKLNDDTTHTYYLLTVLFGLKTYQTYLEWCEEAKKLLKGNGD
jgi:phage/plasmid-associated DNA primase